MRQQAFVRMMAARFGRDRWNEHVKLAATMFNAIAVASLIGAFVAPLVNVAPPAPAAVGFLIVSGVVVHLVGQLTLRYIARKDG